MGNRSGNWAPGPKTDGDSLQGGKKDAVSLPGRQDTPAIHHHRVDLNQIRGRAGGPGFFREDKTYPGTDNAVTEDLSTQGFYHLNRQGATQNRFFQTEPAFYLRHPAPSPLLVRLLAFICGLN